MNTNRENNPVLLQCFPPNQMPAPKIFYISSACFPPIEVKLCHDPGQETPPSCRQAGRIGHGVLVALPATLRSSAPGARWPRVHSLALAVRNLSIVLVPLPAMAVARGSRSLRVGMWSVSFHEQIDRIEELWFSFIP